MIIIGLLLVLAAAALVVAAVYDGGDPVNLDLLGNNLSTTAAGVFFIGMATTALLLLGMWLTQAAVGRARRRRIERKEAKTRQRESVSRLEEERTALQAENEHLAKKLEHERSVAGGDAGVPAGASPTGTETPGSSGDVHGKHEATPGAADTAGTAAAPPAKPTRVGRP